MNHIKTASLYHAESFGREISYSKSKLTNKKLSIFSQECGKGCTPMTPSKKPFEQKGIFNSKIKELVKGYSALISKLSEQKLFHQTLLHKEKTKLLNYYDSMLDHITAYKSSALNFINEKILKTSEAFGLQIGGLKHKIFLLQSENVQPFDKEEIALNAQKTFQIEIFQVKIGNLEEFKIFVNPFLLQITENIVKIESDDETLDMIERQKDDLECDEDLTMQQTIGKSRKYKFDIQNIICQESQSKESSIRTESCENK